MKKETWIVVASSALARIFRLEGQKLVALETLVHPEARMSEHDLVSDRMGSAGEAFGSRRSTYDPPHTPKQTENINFAKKIADHLDRARNNGSLQRLYIAAGPSFLGSLRNEMTAQTQSLIYAEVNKDIIHLSPEEIKSHFTIGI